MKRTISGMMGKGSLKHNSRDFIAENVDPTRTQFNIEYCNENLRTVYHELFNEAQERFNHKQKRKDRMIDDYYEKIRTGKQEKLFYEAVFQIGNKDDTGSKTREGILAAKTLDKFMKEFQKRNPSLRVFSAHLHMDEATPHLHIDFVPYVTGSTRGMDTRVSLKQALAKQGFAGGKRGDTEWNQWIESEKKQLSLIMERNGIEWEQKGTHAEHLSVLDYKKQERTKEVKDLEQEKAELEKENRALIGVRERTQDQIESATEEYHQMIDQRAVEEEKAAKAKKKADKYTANVRKTEQYAIQYLRSPDEWLPETKTFESAKAYRNRIITFLTEVAGIIHKLYSIHLADKDKNERLERRNNTLESRIAYRDEQCEQYREENQMLRSQTKDLERVRFVLGEHTVNDAVQKAIILEQQRDLQKQTQRRRYDRGSR